MKAILTLARELAAGKTTSQALVEEALLRIACPSGEGARVFLRTHRESALAEAKASDALRAHAIVPYDALLMPTVAVVAPAIAPLEADAQLYGETNQAMLRNCSVVNFLDGCALWLPCHQPDQGPVGLMVVGQCGEDRRLLAVGLALESALRQ